MADQVHALKRLNSDLKAGKLPGLLLLCGREQYLVNFCTDLIVKKFVNPATIGMDHAAFDGKDTSAGRIIEACETLPFFSEKRVVSVRDADALSQADREELIKYAKDLPETVILILTEGIQEKKTSLRKQISATGGVYDFTTLERPDLISFIEKRFKAAGKECRSAVISKIINDSGYSVRGSDYDLYSLTGDIDKLISYAGSAGEIKAEYVDEVLSGNKESYIFSMLDAACAGRKGEALTILSNFLEKGENAGTCRALLTRQLELMLDARELYDSGTNDIGAIAKELKTDDWRIRKVLGYAKGRDKDDLRRLLAAALDIPINRIMLSLDERLSLEMLISQL